jgi:hypothetical protein
VRFVGLAGSVHAWEIVTVTADPTSTAASALLWEINEAKSGRRPAAVIR